MLVKRTFYFFLDATKTEKYRQIPYSLTEVVLSLSPDHGMFDNDKIYLFRSPLETLFNCWPSESWG
jgi:3-oxoacyl-ACP reductase-like protein